LMKSYLIRFLRSPLGLIAVFMDAAFAVVLVLTGLLSVPIAIVAFVVVCCITVLTLMQTGLGGAAIVQEKTRERNESDARILGGVAAARKRLSLLRIGDPVVSAALERLVYASGKYLEAQVRGADRDSSAEDAVLGGIEAVDDFLRMEDAARSGRHFHGGADRNEGDQVETGGALAERTARVLNAASDEIERRLDLAAGGVVSGEAGSQGITSADRAAAREDLK
jgi:hypothetical protein